MSKLTDFLLNNGTTNGGFTLKQVLNQTFLEFDLNHTQIQWLFPLEEASGCQPDQPVLTKEDIKILRNSNYRKEILPKTLLYFENFLTYYVDWSRKESHNYLRITRVIRHVRRADTLYRARNLLTTAKTFNTVNGSNVNDKSLVFWGNALYIQDHEKPWKFRLHN